MDVFQDIATFQTGDAVSALGNGSTNPAILNYAADPKLIHLIDICYGGYDAGGTLTGGLLTINYGTYQAKIPFTSTGAFFIPFQIRGNPGAALTLTLADGGNGVTAYLNANHRTQTIPA